MTLKYDIIYKNDIQDKHRSVFGDLLKLQGKVKGDLLTKADRCKFICIVSLDEEPIAIGGIKPKTKEDFHKDKADLLNLENAFEWELVYLYTDTNHSGKGIASNVSRILLEEFGKGNIMASTEITANPGMVKILEKCGFRQYGKPWKSGIHEYYLGLFLRFE
jgi:GNAT superfamily N-acetyltransferase